MIFCEYKILIQQFLFCFILLQHFKDVILFFLMTCSVFYKLAVILIFVLLYIMFFQICMLFLSINFWKDAEHWAHYIMDHVDFVFFLLRVLDFFLLGN